ncbi:MAG TPA: sigma-70 family RNA polymerase sigma factor [Cyclobacteriaceae bacterium]|nr:sigma-70 family RNA polymerase sigma factor [Cyclobacteriaceae bacterium]
MPGFIDNERFRRLLGVLPEKAIKILYEEYCHALITFAESLVHDRRAAEDIVQEAFIHIWEQHEKLSRPDHRSIEHYLIRVVKNKSISYHNKHMQLRLKAVEVNHRLSERSIEARWIDLETSKEIRNIILTFPLRERQCLMMKLDEEVTTQQIADRLKVTRKAVERSLTSAYKRLRKCLKSSGYAVWAGRNASSRPPRHKPV